VQSAAALEVDICAMAKDETEHPTAYPNRPQFNDFMKPCRFEGEVRNLAVQGKIPKGVNGVFYRVMPDPALPPFIENDPVRQLNVLFME